MKLYLTPNEFISVKVLTCNNLPNVNRFHLKEEEEIAEDINDSLFRRIHAQFFSCLC